MGMASTQGARKRHIVSRYFSECARACCIFYYLSWMMPASILQELAEARLEDSKILRKYKVGHVRIHAVKLTILMCVMRVCVLCVYIQWCLLSAGTR